MSVSDSSVPLLQFVSVFQRMPASAGNLIIDASFALHAGDRICITGKSGSGKTTLLSLAGGLQDPTGGSVLYRGISWKEMPSKERVLRRGKSVGFVFQSANLVPVMTAYENVAYALMLGAPHIGDAERRALTLHALEVTGLADRRSARPGTMSGGECQRLSVARAMVKSPALVLADEPTSHLDDENAELVIRLFEDSHRAYGAAFLIVSHDRRLVSVYRKTFSLHNGRLAVESATSAGTYSKALQGTG